MSDITKPHSELDGERKSHVSSDITELRHLTMWAWLVAWGTHPLHEAGLKVTCIIMQTGV